MKILSDEHDIRKAVREIVALLAERNYDAVLDLLEPGLDREKVASEIAEGIWTHGTYDRTLPDEMLGYEVVPLRDKYRETFESFLKVDLGSSYGLDPALYGGMAFAFLPLNGEYEGDVSDLKIELPIRRHPWGFFLERLSIRST